MISFTEVFLITSNIAIASIAFSQRRQIQNLYKCPTYGCLSRQGIDVFWQDKRHRNDLALIFLDVDHMHQLNQQYGYTEVDDRLRQVFSQIRKHEIVGRWYSGDELILLVPIAEAESSANRIKFSLAAQGIGATFGIVRAQNKPFLIEVVKEASALVQDSKARGERGVIVNAAGKT